MPRLYSFFIHMVFSFSAWLCLVTIMVPKGYLKVWYVWPEGTTSNSSTSCTEAAERSASSMPHHSTVVSITTLGKSVLGPTFLLYLRTSTSLAPW